MNIVKLLFLFFLSMLFNKIKGAKFSSRQFSENISFVETKEKSTEKILPGIFDLFSTKPAGIQPNLNFFLEENSNLWLRNTLNNEKNRNMKRNFADFQELRQNDILRFQELMVVQNEQIKLIKNIISSN